MATATIIPRANAEPGRPRRIASLALVAAALLPVIGYLATASGAVASVARARSGALLGSPDGELRARVRAVSPAALRTALTAKPLDQRVANVAMVRTVLDRGEGALAPWVAGVSRLGWRDTPALQNMLYAAVKRSDIASVMDISDALLRRNQLLEQMIPALSVAEADPKLRADLARRIAETPSWRGQYLNSTGHLQTPAQLSARYALFGDMRRLGVKLERAELEGNVRAMDARGGSELAFNLWKTNHPDVATPLNDPGFAQASRSFEAGEETVPFQWELFTGDGFNAGASTDGGRPMLNIEWSGRGVPVFAQQRTTATPGAYMLDVAVASGKEQEVSALAFRLVCPRATVPFRQASGSSTPRFVTERAVPCSYPVLQIAGDIQPSANPHQLDITRLTLRRVGGAARG